MTGLDPTSFPVMISADEYRIELAIPKLMSGLGTSVKKCSN
jgi:hypothetical protein